MWTYIQCPNLPRPPQWLLDQVDVSLRPTANNTGYLQREPLINWRGYSGPAALNVRVLFNNDYVSWVKENITTEFENASLNYVPEPPLIQTTAPHRDYTRDYVLIYNVDTGGNDVKLEFWHEKDKSLVRDPGAACGQRDRLELIDTITGLENCWYLTNATILHSTDYMTRPRINLQISFKEPNTFVQQLIAMHK